MTELISDVRESPEGGYMASAFSASIYTEADTLEELKDQIRDAVRCHFEPGTEPKLLRVAPVSMRPLGHPSEAPKRSGL